MEVFVGRKIQVIDSHTGGEPTRLIVNGGPNLGLGSMAERLECFKKEYDHFRSSVVNEPRGSEVIVGALLCKPVNPQNTAGVIFFNHVGYLGMCGHGTIGVMASLLHMGSIQAGVHTIETPVGDVVVNVNITGYVSLKNIPSYRSAQNVKINVPDLGEIIGDIAWGGNWFFLVHEESCRKHKMNVHIKNIEKLMNDSCNIRNTLQENKITGENGAEIDHIEFFSPAEITGCDSKNFVLCPGKSYDRSPCGTGTSAKLACLFADGKIKEGQTWKQESIIGSVFEGSVQVIDGKIIPTIAGSAFVTAESTLILNEQDPFCWGIPA